jgi:hypothetical protein
METSTRSPRIKRRSLAEICFEGRTKGPGHIPSEAHARLTVSEQGRAARFRAVNIWNSRISKWKNAMYCKILDFDLPGNEPLLYCPPCRPHSATSVSPTAAPSRQDSDNTRKRVRDPKGPSAAPPQPDESLPPHHYRHLSVSIPDRNPSLPHRAESFKTPKAVDFVRSYLPKPLVIPNPSSLVTEAQSILGSPAQQSAELAALLRPITRAFLGDDLDRDKASRAEKCVRKLWDCTQANEAKLLPR